MNCYHSPEMLLFYHIKLRKAENANKVLWKNSKAFPPGLAMTTRHLFQYPDVKS